MSDFGNASASGGGSSLGSLAGAGDTSSLFNDASLGDAISGGSGDLFGGGTGGSPDVASLFADAGLSSALLGDSSGLGGAFNTTTDPSGTAAASLSTTPPADSAGTPSGSDPSGNIGGTQSGGAPQPNQQPTQPTPPAKQQQPASPLAQLAKMVGGAFGLGAKPTAGGPTGPTPQQPQPGGQAGQQALANLLPTMPTPAETGELPPGGYSAPLGTGGIGSDAAAAASQTDNPAAKAAAEGGPADQATPAAPAADPNAITLPPFKVSGGQPAEPPFDPNNPPTPPPRPSDAAPAAPAAPAPAPVALPTRKGPQAPAAPETPPGPSEGQGGSTEGMGEILRDVLGLALGSPTLLPMLAQMMGGRGRGGLPPWAMHGMMPFMRGRGRGFGGFRGGFLRPGYYPRRQGGWGFHGGGYHPGWGAWAPGQGGNQPMAFAGGGGSSGGGGASGGWEGANTQSGGVPDGGGQIGPGADDAYRNSGLGSNPLINTLVGQESAGGQNIVSRTDKDSHGLKLAQGGNPSEISQGYFQIQNHPGGTWQTYAQKAGIDLAKYPTPRSAPIDVQWKVAQLIPISQWGHDTQVAMQRRGFRYNPNMPLGQVAAQFGGTQTQVAGGGSPTPSSSTSRGAPGTPRANIRIHDPDNPIHDYPAPTETGGTPPVQSDDYAATG